MTTEHRFAFLLFIVFFFTGCMPSSDSAPNTHAIRFLPIGDSYTIGEGVDKDLIWPALLARRLKQDGIDIALIDNPGRTGWTTKNAIDRELPVFEAAKPNFSTLLIGVNDWVQGVDAETFRERLSTLMDRMQAVLPANRLIVLTIPDFSVTPTGKLFGDPDKNAEGIRSFNRIIEEEAAERKLPVVDLFELSQVMGSDSSLVNEDGLHPSAKEYQLWMEKIYPVALKLLKQ